MSRSSYLYPLLALALTTVPAAAEHAPLVPRVVPPKDAFLLNDGTLEVLRIVVKFHEGTHVRLRNDHLQQLVSEQTEREKKSMAHLQLTNSQVQADLLTVQRLVRGEATIQQWRSLFLAAEDQLAARRSSGEQRSGKELADLSLYVELALAPHSSYGTVQPLVDQLNALPSVEIAYAEPLSAPATADIAPTTPSLAGEQGYLGPGPVGIDAHYAWTRRGGNGAGVRIVDVEGAWQSTHEDLPALFHAGGTLFADVSWRNHGTAVLGEMVGAANSYGVSGIANGAQAGYESIGSQSPASAIEAGARAAADGGVILIELHAPGPSRGTACICNVAQCNYVAMEYWQANFDAISHAVSNGTTVVEASGNGSANLDDAVYHSLFSRDYRDSGAILVGAAGAGDRVPTCWTNHGSRLDVHGWGESVTTLGYGDRFSGGGDENQYYTASFSGTSSASPIITAAVACIQGANTSAGRFPLSPVALRDILVNTGTPQVTNPRLIGPLPNLRAALTKLKL